MREKFEPDRTGRTNKGNDICNPIENGGGINSVFLVTSQIKRPLSIKRLSNYFCKFFFDRLRGIVESR